MSEPRSQRTARPTGGLAVLVGVGLMITVAAYRLFEAHDLVA